MSKNNSDSFQNSHDRARRIGVSLMILSAFCFAGMTAISKELSRTMHVFEVAVLRVAITAVLIAPYMARRKISFLGNNKKLLFLRGAMGFAALCLGFFAAAHGALGDMTAVWKSAALFSPLFAWVFLKERITGYQAALIFSGFVGLVIVADPGSGVFSFAGGAALCSSILLALIAVSIRSLHRTEHVLTIVQAFCIYGTVLGGAVFFNYFKVPTVNEAVLAILMGTIGTVGQISFTYSFKFSPTAIVQPYSFFEIVFAVLIGYFYWGDRPAWHTIIGIVLIILSGVLLLRSKALSPQKL